jgi:hypothetical protein
VMIEDRELEKEMIKMRLYELCSDSKLARCRDFPSSNLESPNRDHAARFRSRAFKPYTHHLREQKQEAHLWKLRMHSHNIATESADTSISIPS